LTKRPFFKTTGQAVSHVRLRARREKKRKAVVWNIEGSKQYRPTKVKNTGGPPDRRGAWYRSTHTKMYYVKSTNVRRCEKQHLVEYTR